MTLCYNDFILGYAGSTEDQEEVRELRERLMAMRTQGPFEEQG